MFKSPDHKGQTAATVIAKFLIVLFGLEKKKITIRYSEWLRDLFLELCSEVRPCRAEKKSALQRDLFRQNIPLRVFRASSWREQTCRLESLLLPLSIN